MKKSIVITGAGSGLGRALARQVAADGHAPILMGRNVAKLERVAQELGAARVIACDVADPVSVSAAFAEVKQYTGRIDVLINNAGLFQPSLIKDAADAHIKTILDTNLAGPLYCSRAAIPLLGKGGHIINIGSETVVVPVAMLAVYQTSKAGLERFSKTLGQELAAQGIRVTLVRAGKMMEAEMEAPFSPELARQFAEENLKLGVDQTRSAISQYASVATTVAMLLKLPEDVNVSEMMLEGRHM